jgi:hypothetical protein
MLLVAVLAVPLGLWVASAQRQRRAVEALRRMGGQVVYSNDPRHSPNDPKARVPEWLVRSLGDDFFFSVVRVTLGKDVGDEHLGPLLELGTVTHLELWYSRVTDAGLARLSALPRLNSLVLKGGSIGDGGLVYLGDLRRLEHLELDNMHVSDTGLIHLGSLSRLKLLTLLRTHVTQAGEEKVKKAIPGLLVNRWMFGLFGGLRRSPMCPHCQ